MFKTELLKYEKNISSENWGYCSTKVNLSNLITRLNTNIDFIKNSLWWTACFLFDENQSYTENNYCKNKETLSDSFTREFEREIKNKVISSKVEHLSVNIMGNIIDIKS